MKRPIAILLCLLMTTVSLTGCFGGGDDESPETPEPTPSLEDWDVYYVDSDADLPNCNSETIGRLYYVEADAGFQTCTSTGWIFIDLTGPAGADGTDGYCEPCADGNDGTNGADGADGAPGTNGTDGVDGADGADGSNGHNALAVTSTESAGSNCANGGIKIEVGVDDNDDGSLQTSEIDQTTYICNGVDGQDGADGSASQYTMLTSISPPSASLRCNVGGRVIAQGLDNGDGGGTAQNGILEYGEVDYTTTYCSKYDIRAVTDIAPSSISSLWPGTPALQILVEDTLYFTADDGNSGIELWAHDTASSSTLLVEAIFPGSSNSNPGQYMQILVGDTIYFDADDGSSGYELWAHDTSNSTTWQVADIQNGGGHSYPGYDMKVVLVEDTIYFDADDGNSGRELWAHDTSNSTTWQVADLNSGGLGSNPGFGNTVILTDDTMFLGTWNGLYAYNTQNHSYWRLSSPSSTIRNFVSLGDVIFYYSNDGNQRLTATNTSNGTWWSIMENSCAMVGPAWYFYTVVSNILYFDHDDCTSGSEFWAYNLENDSAWQIADINPGSGSSVLWYFNGFISIGSTMYFAADGTNGVELYAHDSSNHSTWLVADINSGGGDSYPGGYAWIWKLVGDSIYFSADGGDGFELWMHTPSSGLTWQLADIRPGSQGSNPGEEVVILVGDTIYFSANDGSSGTELWAVETILTNSITYD